MKRVIVSSMLFVLTSSLFGMDSGNRVEVSATAMMEKVDSDSYIDNHILLYGLRATIYESEVDKYGLQLAYEGATGADYTHRAMGKPNDTAIHRVMANLIVDGEEEYSILPYVAFGVGYEKLGDEYPKHETSQAFGNVGMGFKYDLGNGFNTSLEGRYIGKFDTGDNDFSIGFVFGYELVPSNANKEYSSDDRFHKATIMENIALPSETAKSRVTVVKVRPNYTDYQQYTQDVSSTPKSNDIENSPYTEVVSDSGYFVEVAAYRTTPTQSMVDRLVSAGYSNVTTKDQNGISLVLVGPYQSRAEANEIKAGVRSIAHDAFIVHF